MALIRFMCLILGLTLVNIASATSSGGSISINAASSSFEARVLLLETSSNTGSSVDCWNALMEIKSCSNEIVLFFLNGQSNNNIGAECCRAIATISHNCWPAILTFLGFTAEEANILRGYCDNADSATPPLAAASPTQH